MHQSSGDAHAQPCCAGMMLHGGCAPGRSPGYPSFEHYSNIQLLHWFARNQEEAVDGYTAATCCPSPRRRMCSPRAGSLRPCSSIITADRNPSGMPTRMPAPSPARHRGAEDTVTLANGLRRSRRNLPRRFGCGRNPPTRTGTATNANSRTIATAD